MNIAETFKKQTDKTLRQRSQGPNAGMTIIETETGVPGVSKPASDLTRHKASGDHDGRYYTEDEVDDLIADFATSLSGASPPAAAEAYRGVFFLIEGGTGVADVLQVCVKKDDDTYAWRTVGLS